MNIVILHNAVSSDDSPEDLDTLTQARAISESLGRLGYRGVAVPCTLDLAALRETLLECRPQLVFNLVESLGGTDSLAYLASARVGRPRAALHRQLDRSPLHDQP